MSKSPKYSISRKHFSSQQDIQMGKADEEIGKHSFNLNKGIQSKNLEVIAKAYEGLGAGITKFVAAANKASEKKKRSSPTSNYSTQLSSFLRGLRRGD